MSWVLAGEAQPRPAARSNRAEIASFAACVLITLTFTQMWLMPLTGPEGDAEASAIIRSLYFPAYGVTLALMALNIRQVALGFVKTPLLWALMGYIFLSVVWSTDPSTTQRRAVAVLFTTFGGLVIGARYDWLGIARILAATSAVTAFCSIFLAVLVPSYGVMHTLFPGAWRGVWYEKNLLGDHMAQAVLFALAAVALDARWRRVWAGVALACLGLVVMSTSKTSLVTLIMGLGAMGFVWVVRRGLVAAIVGSWAALCGLALLGASVWFASDALFALLGKDATLTGRTQIWTALTRQVQTRPWTGFGYAAVWDDKSIWSPMAWISKDAGFVAHHAHNSWLEAWLGLGYGGLALWAAIFVFTWARGVRSAYVSRGGVLALPFLMAFSLTTLTESVAFVYNDYVWVVFTMIAVRLAMGETSPVRRQVGEAVP